MNINKIFLATLVSLSLISCAAFQNPKVVNGVAGAGAGSVVGSIAGAAVASSIANGDIPASMALGAGIGMAGGALIGVTYTEMKQNRALAKNNEIIEDNRQYILERQEQIEELREDIIFEYKTIEIDESLEDKTYTGPTIGIYK